MKKKRQPQPQIPPKRRDPRPRDTKGREKTHLLRFIEDELET